MVAFCGSGPEACWLYVAGHGLAAAMSALKEIVFAGVTERASAGCRRAACAAIVRRRGSTPAACPSEGRLGWLAIQGVRCYETSVLGACCPCGCGNAGVRYTRSQSLQFRFIWVCAPYAPREQDPIVILGLCLIKALESSKPLKPVAPHDR